MQLETFYLSCLAQASYLVGDGGECALVDPRRDVDVYIDSARERGLRIRHVIETHLHADFVSGHVELARRTGATIHIGRAAGAAFPHHPVDDGDEIVMGEVTLRFLATPGHTPESVCVLVLDGGRPTAVFTGDTLFIGDVGRPDLVAARGHSSEEMAGQLHDSLHRRLLTLPDDVVVHPAHGAGSACGRAISRELSSTIGEQRATNWALQPMERDAFVAALTRGLTPPPAYFPRAAAINRRGAEPLDALAAPAALSAAELAARAEDGAVVLDVRPAEAFAAGHVPGAVNIGLSGMFASWCGTLLDGDEDIVVVAEDRAGADEAVMRLARVGMHRVVGRLEGGTDAWAADGRPLARWPRVDAGGLAALLAGDEPPRLLDVRDPGEYERDHVPGAESLPLPELGARLASLDPERPVAVICQSGYRSSAAASLLARAGRAPVCDVSGGTAGWIASGRSVERSEPAAT